MAISISKRKSKHSKKSVLEERKFYFFDTFFFKLLYRIPTAIFLILILLLWCSSTIIISGKFIHVCVSSRKLGDFYCFSAGTQPNFEIPIPAMSSNSSFNGDEKYIKKIVDVSGVSSQSRVSISNINPISSFEIEKNETSLKKDDGDEIARSISVIEEQLREHRLSMWKSSGDNREKECEGRGIYVYELPSKFNKDLVSHCDDMVPWMDFCKYFSNEAFGESIPKLGKGWYQTHQYSLEPIFHSRVLKHNCRVHDQNEAKLFYVPYYGGLDVLRWHFKNVSNNVKDSLGLELVEWLESKRSWVQNFGKDHVFVLGKISWDFRRSKSWGTRFLELNQMQNPTKLLIERQPWHENDIGIPHPTYFHPHSDDEISHWQWKIIKSKRKNLVGFAGAARPEAIDNIRSLLIKHCTLSPRCRHLDCNAGNCEQPDTVIDLFSESEFCFQPPGDSPTRKSVFDSLIAGCIPVFFDPFTAYYQYPWHLPEDHSKYSVFIDKKEVMQQQKNGSNDDYNVVKRLMEISKEKREEMRSYIVYELMPGLVYGDSNNELDKFKDAFSIAINNLLQRVSKL